MDWHDIPTIALKSFEDTTGLTVTVHDLAGTLWRHMPLRSGVHWPAPCTMVKGRSSRECTAFDVERVRAACGEHPDGFVKVCHGGYVEWVVPSFGRGKLEWVVFAGLRCPGEGLKADLETAPLARYRGEALKLEPVTGGAEADRFLEMLRQLVARLREWVRSGSESVGSGTMKATAGVERGVRVRSFIHQQFRADIQLADVAKHLGLSVSRAAHAVKESCGRPFVRLLAEERLKEAASMLRHTDLAVIEIAMGAGFGDVSHFHRLFRREFGMSPHQYRKHVSSESGMVDDPGKV